MPVSKKELKAILADKRYWKRYEKPFGWKLAGWTYQHSAQFFRKDGSSVFVGDRCHIRASELDLILKREQPTDGVTK